MQPSRCSDPAFSLPSSLWKFSGMLCGRVVSCPCPRVRPEHRPLTSSTAPSPPAPSPPAEGEALGDHCPEGDKGRPRLGGVFPERNLFARSTTALTSSVLRKADGLDGRGRPGASAQIPGGRLLPSLHLI